MGRSVPHEGDCVSWLSFDGGTPPWTFHGSIWSAAPPFKGHEAFWVQPDEKSRIFAGGGVRYVVRASERIITGQGKGIGGRWLSGYSIEKGEFVEDRWNISPMAQRVRALKANRMDLEEWVPVDQSTQNEFFELCERLSRDGGGR